MSKRVSMMIFFTLLIVGVILIPITYFVSNQVIYYHEIKVDVNGGVSIPIRQEYGNMIINGTINGSLRLYLIDQALLKEKYLGNFSGKIYLNTYDDGYTTFFMLADLYPSKVDLLLRVYNSSFAPTGYTISGLILALAIIFGFYSMKFANKTMRRKKYKFK